MANEQRVRDILVNAGFEPVEDRGIIVKFAPANLSAAIANFFSMEFYVLQMCRDELVLVPFSKLSGALEKSVTLEIPYAAIRSVEVSEELLNDRITITTGTDVIAFTAQQKELSGWRTSSVLSWYMDGLKISSWHAENMDGTLKALRALGQPA